MMATLNEFSAYKVGAHLSLQLNESYLNSHRANGTVIVTVLQVYEPVSMSPVMKVKVQGESKPLVLKLYDPRFSTQVRKDGKLPVWSEELKRTYVDFVNSGEAARFVDFLNSDDDEDDDDDEDWNPAEWETYVFDKCQDMFKAEREAYETLKDLKGKSIPRLYGTVTLRTHFTDSSTLQKFFDVRGLILEHVDGFRLADLTDHAPKQQWNLICDKSVSTVDSIMKRGLLNEDVSPRNCLVRERIPGSYEPVIIDFALSRTRLPDESEDEWNKARREKDELRKIGVGMQVNLHHRGGDYVYDASYNVY